MIREDDSLHWTFVFVCLFQTKKDVIDWIRLFFMVLVSGAVTIHAVIYPSFPLSVESLRVAFSRAIFGLFLTKIDDLDGEEGVCLCVFARTGPVYRHVNQKSI